MFNDCIKFIDIDATIKKQKELLSNRIRKNNFSKEVFQKRYDLGRIEGDVFKIKKNGVIDDQSFRDNHEKFEVATAANAKSHHLIGNIFNRMCKLLDFDYEEVIEIRRMEEYIELLEEIQENKGFVIIIEEEEWCGSFYFFENGATYRMTDGRIFDVDNIPDFLLKDERVKREVEKL